MVEAGTVWNFSHLEINSFKFWQGSEGGTYLQYATNFKETVLNGYLIEVFVIFVYTIFFPQETSRFWASFQGHEHHTCY